MIMKLFCPVKVHKRSEKENYAEVSIHFSYIHHFEKISFPGLSLQKKKPKLELTERPTISTQIPPPSTVRCENDIIPSSQSPLQIKFNSSSSKPS